MNKRLFPSAEIRTKLSATKGTAILVYDLNDLLVISLTSAKEVAKHYGSNHSAILKYASSPLRDDPSRDLEKLFKANAFCH